MIEEENSDDEEAKVPILDTTKLKEKAKKEICAHSLLSDFKPMESAFTIKVEEDQQKLDKVSKMLKAKGKRMNDKFKRIVDEELGNYGLPKDHEDDMNTKLELDFILDSSEEDEKLEELFREKTGDELW